MIKLTCQIHWIQRYVVLSWPSRRHDQPESNLSANQILGCACHKWIRRTANSITKNTNT